MKRGRFLLLMLSLAISIALAFAARNLVYELVVLPISYLLWQLAFLLAGVPEVVRWAALIVILVLVIAWQLVPELGPRAHRIVRHPPGAGQVEGLAVWLVRARRSNYFKWQLAHRLGLVSRRLEALERGHSDGQAPGDDVADYLGAGMNSSFVDFSSRRKLFERPIATPLDTDPAQVVAYLEDQAFMNRGEHA